MAKYMLPGVGSQMESEDSSSPNQAAPLLRYYSPRLFGAPPQLTNQCDMRILSSDGTNPGPVGDFYLSKILQDANIANFVVGRARFIGGMSSLANVIRECYYYGKAMSKYEMFGSTGELINTGSIGSTLSSQASLDAYKSAYGSRDTEAMSLTKDEDGTSILSGIEGSDSFFGSFANLGKAGAGFIASLKTSLSVQQPFYTFEADWSTYINNVKMMINTAVIMLGLQHACVRIGDDYLPLGMYVKETAEKDVWANYRFITPTSGQGDVTEIATDNGDTSQYVSFMIDASGVSESISNTYGPSQIFSSVINAGGSTGAEIAFITNSTGGSSSDMTVNLAKESKAAAEEVLDKLSTGSGRFTAAIASSMARSFIGDHTIYPEVFQSHSATTSMSVTVHLTSAGGDAYSYLTDILVPLFFMFGMALPMLSNNNASAYSYPPVIQCNIPGLWGTRLGAIESLSITKNPSGKDVSINGYPLQVDVTMNIKDLQHVLMTSPMDKPSVFLNNHTMFDYIAQISGVDKYRVNGSMRTMTRLALTASACSPDNFLHNMGDALLSDWHSFVNNKVFKYDRQ